MDYKKVTLFVALALVLAMLWSAWQREHVANPDVNIHSTTSATNPVSSVTSSGNSDVPSAQITNSSKQISSVSSSSKAASTNNIQVKTDVMNVNISLQGGNIIGMSLSQYPAALGSTEPFQLLEQTPDDTYIAQSGIISSNGPDTNKGQGIYSADKKEYVLNPGQNTLAVNLKWQKNGLTVIKTYIFTRGTYAIQQQYKIVNHSGNVFNGYSYMQLQRTKPVNKKSISQYGLYTGAAISTPENRYQKISFKSMDENNLALNASGGWISMLQHYFLSAWIPDNKQDFHYYSHVQQNNYTIGVISPALQINNGAELVTTSQLYAGPAIADNLDTLSPHLSMTIDYGWLWFISVALFWVMKHIHQVVGNWGISIILLTIVIKLVFFHLSTKSYRSMAHMRRMQPRMQQLKERYAGDKPSLSKAMMELYKKEKINPLGGCLPMLIQIPFFIGLYYMIIESVELRQAPFFLWIHDLSVADPYYILPIIMGGLMFLQQRLNPPAPDPVQQRVMMFLPLMFTIFFLNFPAGLVLYWITNTAFGMLHQWWCIRQVNKLEEKHPGHHKKTT